MIQGSKNPLDNWYLRVPQAAGQMKHAYFKIFRGSYTCKKKIAQSVEYPTAKNTVVLSCDISGLNYEIT